jgi:NAD(P)-dependent dehydrogenase (short-subunit alcohol dehydrogenase family)
MSRTVLITGASSGIGEALARELARRGYRLALLARRIEVLEALAMELRSAGSPEVVTAALDVRNAASIEPALRAAADSLGGLDIVIANAGVAHSAAVGRGTLEQLIETFEVDLTGACATIDAAMRHFRERGHGQVVAITSVARYRGLPGFGAYSAAKQGLHRYMQALRIESSHENIQVTELAPGYIDTPMNRGSASRPFLIDAEKGARIMADMIESGVAYATVPRMPWRLIGSLMRIIPPRWLAPGRRRN